MKKRGYRPAIGRSGALQCLVGELRAYSDLIPELLTKVEAATRGFKVTKAELKRDFGFSASALRLLERSGQLRPLSSGGRPTYRLDKALRIRVLQPWVVTTRNVRTRRKHANITSIYRDVVNRMTEGASPAT